MSPKTKQRKRTECKIVSFFKIIYASHPSTQRQLEDAGQQQPSAVDSKGEAICDSIFNKICYSVLASEFIHPIQPVLTKSTIHNYPQQVVRDCLHEPDLLSLAQNFKAMPRKTSRSIRAPEKRTFTVFNKLPTELRLMVWRFSCSERRAVTIRIGYCLCPYHKRWACYSETTNPAILFVNHESRKEGLKSYCLLSDPCTSPDSRVDRLAPRLIYFNPLVDQVILLGCNRHQYAININLSEVFSINAIEKTKFLAIAYSFIRQYLPANFQRIASNSVHDDILRTFNGLTDLTLMINPCQHVNYSQDQREAFLKEMDDNAIWNFLNFVWNDKNGAKPKYNRQQLRVKVVPVDDYLPFLSSILPKVILAKTAEEQRLMSTKHLKPQFRPGPNNVTRDDVQYEHRKAKSRFYRLNEAPKRIKIPRLPRAASMDVHFKRLEAEILEK